LIVTHRPALLEIADRVVELSGGRFVEGSRRGSAPADASGQMGIEPGGGEVARVEGASAEVFGQVVS
jgi:hypothetical protein